MGFHIAGEQAQHLAERQVGISDAGLSVAVPNSDDEVCVSLLSAAGELDDKGCLAGPRLTGNEAYLPLACLCLGRLAGKSPAEERLELGQFSFPSDKYLVLQSIAPSNHPPIITSRQSGGKWEHVPTFRRWGSWSRYGPAGLLDRRTASVLALSAVALAPYGPASSPRTAALNCTNLNRNRKSPGSSSMLAGLPGQLVREKPR